MPDWLERETDRKYHPRANLFPLLEGSEYEELKADIAANGLLEAIWLHQDESILDGRNRHRACIETETEPRFRTWTGDGSPLLFVVSMNLKRRHLTYDQRVGIGLKLEPAFAIEAAERQQATQFKNGAPPVAPNSEQPVPRAAEQAAQQVKVGKSAIYEMIAVQKDDPELPEKLIAGKTTVRKERKKREEKKKREEVKAYTERVVNSPTLEKVYNVIYADPPWDYGGSGIMNAEACSHYAVMSFENIKQYLQTIALQIADDAVLFLWVTNPFLEQSFEVVKAWGFQYKTNIVWRKTELKKWGVGFYVRGQHELLLICTRGSFTPLDKNISPPISSVLEAPIGEHSAKPEEAYHIIETLYPNCTYIELFARQTREQWDTLGNEAS
jgi:N6-adenosine-specific RNA methylase IME4